MFQQFAAVCLVVGLAVLAAAWFRRGKSGSLLGYRFRIGAGKRLTLVERIPLSPQHSLCLVRVDGRELLIGVHTGGITVIQQADRSVERGESAQ